jgi:hypothetical protein
MNIIIYLNKVLSPISLVIDNYIKITISKIEGILFLFDSFFIFILFILTGLSLYYIYYNSAKTYLKLI